MNRGTVFGVNKVVGLNFRTKQPIFVSELLTSVTFNDTGELVGQMAGRIKYPLAHYEGPKSLELQFTGKDFSAGLIQACTGHSVTNIDSDSNKLQEIDSKNAKLTLAFDAGNMASLFYGSFALVYNGTDWDHYLVEDSIVRNRLTIDKATLTLGSFNIPGHDQSAISLSNGLTGLLAESYVPAAGDFYLYQIFPTNADALAQYQITANQNSQRPYVSLIIAAENQANSKSIYIPKARCSSGFPHNFNENTPNEFQVSFMCSQDADGELYKIQTVERES